MSLNPIQNYQVNIVSIQNSRGNNIPLDETYSISKFVLFNQSYFDLTTSGYTLDVKSNGSYSYNIDVISVDDTCKWPYNNEYNLFYQSNGINIYIDSNNEIQIELNNVTYYGNIVLVQNSNSVSKDNKNKNIIIRPR